MIFSRRQSIQRCIVFIHSRRLAIKNVIFRVTTILHNKLPLLSYLIFHSIYFCQQGRSAVIYANKEGLHSPMPTRKVCIYLCNKKGLHLCMPTRKVCIYLRQWKEGLHLHSQQCYNTRVHQLALVLVCRDGGTV